MAQTSSQPHKTTFKGDGGYNTTTERNFSQKVYVHMQDGVVSMKISSQNLRKMTYANNTEI